LFELVRLAKDEALAAGVVGHEGSRLRVLFSELRRWHSPTEWIVFYRHAGTYYYPLAFEFRSVNNNLLHLVLELGIRDFDVLASFVQDSLQRHERLETVVRALVVEMPSEPPYAVPLRDFSISEALRDLVYL